MHHAAPHGFDRREDRLRLKPVQESRCLVRRGDSLLFHLQLVHNLVHVGNRGGDHCGALALRLRVHVAGERNDVISHGVADVVIQIFPDESRTQVALDPLIQGRVYQSGILLSAQRKNGNLIRNDLGAREARGEGCGL